MQKALQLDQAVIKEDGTPEYVDGTNGVAIDTETVSNESEKSDRLLPQDLPEFGDKK
jgi:hypothetical protein